MILKRPGLNYTVEIGHQGPGKKPEVIPPQPEMLLRSLHLTDVRIFRSKSIDVGMVY